MRLLVQEAEHDWVNDPAFRELFTQELAQEIESALMELMMIFQPGAQVGRVQGAFKTQIVGDGKIEIIRVDPAKQMLDESPRMRAEDHLPPDETREPPKTVPREDLVKMAVDEAMGRVPTILERVRSLVRRGRPPNIGGLSQVLPFLR